MDASANLEFISDKRVINDKIRFDVSYYDRFTILLKLLLELLLEMSVRDSFDV